MIVQRFVLLLSLASSYGWAQSWPSSISPIAKQPACLALNFQQHTSSLTLHEKTCLFAAREFSTAAFLKAALFSGVSQWRNVAPERGRSASDYGERFGRRVAQTAAKNSAEFLAGALNHEDPRFHPSGRTGIWKRTASALWGVVATKTDDGTVRPAFSRMAGALGGGFVGMSCLPSQRLFHPGLDGLQRSGLVYGTYFSTAVFNEFRPDLLRLSSRILKNR